MNCRTIDKIFKDTAYVKFAGTEGEKRCAEYITELCRKIGLTAQSESFTFNTFKVSTERLTVDNEDFDCRGYLGAPNGSVSGKLYFLRSTDATALKKCKDKIVLTEKPFNSKLYYNLVQNGAKGVITFSGNVNFPDNDIDVRRIGFSVEPQNAIPAVIVNIKSALKLIKKQGKQCSICLEQSEYQATSQNIVLDIAGESKKQIIVTAHYDTTALSIGAYDNMSGAVALLYMAEYFSKNAPKFSIRLVWCGSEEQGLLGSLEYCQKHKDELNSAIINVNLDMIGSVMGEFTAFSCADEKMEEYLGRFLKRHRFIGGAKHQIRSSDSNSFIYHGVPAVSFARYAPPSLAQIHTRYDTDQILSAESMLTDMKIITAFIEDLQKDYEAISPIKISEKIKNEVENYFQSRLTLKG